MVAVFGLVLTSCGGVRVSSQDGTYVLPALRYVTPDKRGTIKFFDDTFGDPVPDGITAGPDGALWFTDPGNDVIGRITTKGDYTLQQPANVEVSVGITAAPDNALYFTAAQSNAQIGKITTDGTVTLFSDPGGAYPQGITVGLDGALWFAESNGTVGRMDTKGTVTHFTVAASNAELEGIVTGPDGNLWVTEYIVGGSRFANKVIRLTTSGKYKTFTVGSGPQSICVGLDNALWFSESGAGAIGRITTSGKYEHFPVLSYSIPNGIATGPDHALWFADGGVHAIGRITIKGKIKLYVLRSGFPELQQIAAGPDARMWFTNDYPPSIGRITVGK